MSESIRPSLSVVPSGQEFEQVTANDIERLQVAVNDLRSILCDPIALIERVKLLLEGNAPRLLGAAPLFVLASCFHVPAWIGSLFAALPDFL